MLRPEQEQESLMQISDPQIIIEDNLLDRIPDIARATTLDTQRLHTMMEWGGIDRVFIQHAQQKGVKRARLQSLEIRDYEPNYPLQARWYDTYIRVDTDELADKMDADQQDKTSPAVWAGRLNEVVGKNITDAVASHLTTYGSGKHAGVFSAGTSIAGLFAGSIADVNPITTAVGANFIFHGSMNILDWKRYRTMRTAEDGGFRWSPLNDYPKERVFIVGSMAVNQERPLFRALPSSGTVYAT